MTDKPKYFMKWVTGIDQYVDCLALGYELCPDESYPAIVPDNNGDDMYRMRKEIIDTNGVDSRNNNI